jgi:hypothetical protein
MLRVLSGAELIQAKDPPTEITKITEVGTDRLDRNICLLDLCDHLSVA